MPISFSLCRLRLSKSSPLRASSLAKPQAAKSPSGPQKFLDRAQDRIAVGDAAGDHVLFLVDHLVDVLEELARAVGAFDLAVAEQVELGEQLLVEDVDAVGDVVAPVVAVGEVEGVQVPLVRRKALRDDLVAQL